MEIRKFVIYSTNEKKLFAFMNAEGPSPTIHNCADSVKFHPFDRLQFSLGKTYSSVGQQRHFYPFNRLAKKKWEPFFRIQG